MLQAGIIAFIVVLGICALLNLLSLPGNWIMAALVVLWHFFGPDGAGQLTWGFFVLFFGLALVGELIEFLTQIWGGKKTGSSRAVTISGMVGAFAGGILGAPLLFGFGAVLGALAGAWLGSLFAELGFERHPLEQAIKAANSALFGRFLGMVVKLGLGITMVVITAAKIWPG